MANYLNLHQMPDSYHQITRRDRFYYSSGSIQDGITPLESTQDVLSRLSRPLNSETPEEFEKFTDFINSIGLYRKFNTANYYKDGDTYCSSLRETCMPRQVIKDSVREMQARDTYLIFNEDKITRWDFFSHWHDRLVAGMSYKWKLKYFFREFPSWGEFQRNFLSAFEFSFCLSAGIFCPVLMLILDLSLTLIMLFASIVEIYKLSCAKEQKDVSGVIFFQQALSSLVVAFCAPPLFMLSLALEILSFITRIIAWAINRSYDENSIFDNPLSF
jgi:hypothetical protein